MEDEIGSIKIAFYNAIAIFILVILVILVISIVLLVMWKFENGFIIIIVTIFLLVALLVLFITHVVKLYVEYGKKIRQYLNLINTSKFHKLGISWTFDNSEICIDLDYKDRTMTNPDNSPKKRMSSTMKNYQQRVIQVASIPLPSILEDEDDIDK